MMDGHQDEKAFQSTSNLSVLCSISYPDFLSERRKVTNENAHEMKNRTRTRTQIPTTDAGNPFLISPLHIMQHDPKTVRPQQKREGKEGQMT
jgi:hypothetical protein